MLPSSDSSTQHLSPASAVRPRPCSYNASLTSNLCSTSTPYQVLRARCAISFQVGLKVTVKVTPLTVDGHSLGRGPGGDKSEKISKLHDFRHKRRRTTMMTRNDENRVTSIRAGTTALAPAKLCNMQFTRSNATHASNKRENSSSLHLTPDA